MPEPSVLRLTTEELCLLQGAQGIDTFPGLEANLLLELDDVQKTQALRTAAHTLRARGLVGWDDAQCPRINPLVAEMLLDYAHPHSTLFVDTYVASLRVIPFLYAFGEQAIYEQCQPEPDILQLRTLDQEELWKRLYPHLELEESQGRELGRGEVVQSVLNKGIRVAHENKDAAARLFSDSLSQPLAENLATAYSDPKVAQYMARWKQTPTKEHPLPLAALTILQGQKWSYLLWVEEPQKGEEARVSVRPATRHLLQAYIERILNPCGN